VPLTIQSAACKANLMDFRLYANPLRDVILPARLLEAAVPSVILGENQTEHHRAGSPFSHPSAPYGHRECRQIRMPEDKPADRRPGKTEETNHP